MIKKNSSARDIRRSLSNKLTLSDCLIVILRNDYNLFRT